MRHARLEGTSWCVPGRVEPLIRLRTDLTPAGKGHVESRIQSVTNDNAPAPLDTGGQGSRGVAGVDKVAAREVLGAHGDAL